MKNIEATEKAKREMEEKRRSESKIKRGPEDEDFAAARCEHRAPSIRIPCSFFKVALLAPLAQEQKDSEEARNGRKDQRE